MIIGYARVSSDEQDLALQQCELEKIGCDQIFVDHGISGVVALRPGLTQALAALNSGDTLVVWRLDRLGRSLGNLIKFLEGLHEKGVKFHSIMECIDTRSSGGRFFFHVFGAVAEYERNLISERTRAGMAAAKAKGKHLGRPPSLDRDQCKEAFQMINEKGISPKCVAELFRVHPRTLRRLLGQYTTWSYNSIRPENRRP